MSPVFEVSEDAPMAYYSALKSTYVAVMPDPLRRLIRDKRYPIHRIFGPIKTALQSVARHEDVYDQAYFEESVEPLAKKSGRAMARAICDEFHPATVVDVGCGTGAVLASFAEFGVNGIGLDYSDPALNMARDRGVDARKLDLEQPLDKLPVLRSDVALSTEVAEHLPAKFADGYVGFLARTSDTVVMTAAPPGQGGTDHVNEQPREYWIEKFRGQGMKIDEACTERIQRSWRDNGVADFYYRNLLVFRRDYASGKG